MCGDERGFSEVSTFNQRSASNLVHGFHNLFASTLLFPITLVAQHASELYAIEGIIDGFVSAWQCVT